MAEQLLTPSKIAAFLDCEHYLTLSRRCDAGVDVPRAQAGAMARMLMDKGLQHEQQCLDHFRALGLTVVEVPERHERERFAQWVERVGNPVVDAPDVVFQLPLMHNGIRGVADFVIKVDTPDGPMYEPMDAKLARAEAKPAHVLQLCFYADALEALTGTAAAELHVWLGSGEIEKVRRKDVAAYWRRMQHRLRRIVSDDTQDDTYPEPCRHCDFCEFRPACDQQWRGDDSLIYVAGLGRSDRERLSGAGHDTLAALATVAEPVEAIDPLRLDRLVGQARLQVQQREAPDGAPPPYRTIDDQVPDDATKGFIALPAPSPGDVVLDFEGHPFWRPERGLFFLFGLIARDHAGQWVFEERWAHDEASERQAVMDLIDDLVARRQADPGMHVYHYNHTERSSLERLATDYRVREAELHDLVTTGCFVDLLPVVTGAIQAGVESYGLKHVEQLTGYQRAAGIEQGSGAVVDYDEWCQDNDPERLRRIGAYNEDDVRATLALRDWLVTQRAPELPWRPAVFEYEPPEGPDVDELAQRLRAGPDVGGRHLLGDLVGYWQREARAASVDIQVRMMMDEHHQLDDTSVITGLQPVGPQDRYGKKGTVLGDPAMRFRFPTQEVGPDLESGQVVFAGADGTWVYAGIHELHPDTNQIDLVWGEKCQDAGAPLAVVASTSVSPKPKPQALAEFAEAILADDPDAKRSAQAALLRADHPRFTDSFTLGPEGFGDDLDQMKRWAAALDHSYVAVQGPPGTGKTYTGAHLIHHLVTKHNRRVGITAMSHAAIDNLLDGVCEVFASHGDLGRLNAVRKAPDNRELGDHITHATDAKKAAKPEFNLVTGTTWQFANQAMCDEPVDVLFVDEAGQLSLADAIAAAGGARNVVLLGDPLQLPQVAQATHPGGSGASVLEHVLGDATTMPPDRGVFLSETRRMHPDVCGFISHQIYEGRLSSHPDCATQASSLGTGLRWITVDHHGCSTESEPEADAIVAQVHELLAATWTNHKGETGPITAADILVVAPYNDQVNLIRSRLDADPVTADVRVGTVDKFQGQEAAAVIYSMTASSAADVSRGLEFLFSRNRLNVALSRARVLAYVVCTEALLDSAAKSVEEMRLINTLCAAREGTGTARVMPPSGTM